MGADLGTGSDGGEGAGSGLSAMEGIPSSKLVRSMMSVVLCVAPPGAAASVGGSEVCRWVCCEGFVGHVVGMGVELKSSSCKRDGGGEGCVTGDDGWGCEGDEGGSGHLLSRVGMRAPSLRRSSESRYSVREVLKRLDHVAIPPRASQVSAAAEEGTVVKRSS